MGGSGRTSKVRRLIDSPFAWASLATALAIACGGAATGGARDPGPETFALDYGNPEIADPGVNGDAERSLDPIALPDVAGDPGIVTPEDPGPLDCTHVKVTGVTCAPSQHVTVAYADVTLDVTGPCTGGQAVHRVVKSDAQGAYTFNDVPPGTATLSFARGSYASSTDLPITAGQDVHLAGMAKRCFNTVGSARLAVVTGNADNIESLLDDLGLDHDTFSDGTDTTPVTAVLKSPAHDFLTDLTKLQDYDIVFIDCSSSVQAMLEGSATIPGNLKAFVESGKALYASDWAWAYIEKTWPGAITFTGVPDSFVKGSGDKPEPKNGPRQGPGPTLSEKQKGAAPYTTTGQIVDADLAAAVGKTSTTLYYDLGTWVVLSGPGSGVTAIEATVTGPSGTWGVVPQLVTFQPAGTNGRVLFTSFHNIAQQDAGGNVDDIKAILSYVVFSL